MPDGIEEKLAALPPETREIVEQNIALSKELHRHGIAPNTSFFLEVRLETLVLALFGEDSEQRQKYEHAVEMRIGQRLEQMLTEVRQMSLLQGVGDAQQALELP